MKTEQAIDAAVQEILVEHVESHLNVRGMARDRSLARSTMDGAFGELRRQLTCQARMTGTLLVVADR